MEAFQLAISLSDERESVMRIVGICVSDVVIDPALTASHVVRLDAICSLLPRIALPSFLEHS